MKRPLLLSIGLSTLAGRLPESTPTAQLGPTNGQPAGHAGCCGNSDPVIVYSSRQEHLIKPVFDRFTEETGIEVQYQTGEEGPLIARLEAEGDATFADVLYTVDAATFGPLPTRACWPASIRRYWKRTFLPTCRTPRTAGSGFRPGPHHRLLHRARRSCRTRPMRPWDPAWQGRLCLRTSKKVYNMSLVAPSSNAWRRRHRATGAWLGRQPGRAGIQAIPC